jgi:hypothetical protein
MHTEFWVRKPEGKTQLGKSRRGTYMEETCNSKINRKETGCDCCGLD